MKSRSPLIFSSLVVCAIACVSAISFSNTVSAQATGPDTIVDRYRADADRLIEAALADSFAYDRLAYMTDTFGPRFSGSTNLESAIDWMLEAMAQDGLQNVIGEEVMVPHWVRGDESLTLMEPHESNMQILGLGGSVGTPPMGITAEVLVVKDFDDLDAHADEARGKIVLFNNDTWRGYDTTYRRNGAIRAAQVGAIAILIRSVAPASMSTPHTGTSNYDENTPRIPKAAVTLEDANMMQRMQNRGQKIVVRLKMGATTLPDVLSRNVLAEVVGSEFPDEIIVLGGHIDSWDVGQGAMDDGGGVVAAWQAVKLIQDLGLKPKRTVRVVAWTNEENGMRGANGYRDAHVDEIDNHILGIESDGGVFKPRGFGFSGSGDAYDLLVEIGQLLEGIEAGQITRGGGGADIGPLMAEGMPGMGLSVDGTEYFWYHHTHADTIDKLDPHELNLCVAAMAVMAYVVADMDQRLPR
ncbi:MAG: peptidase M28 family protein [Bacteroidetes bacterium]|nr:MAG: peptidase M28 family protein [Bacteroidota bacterium]